LVKAKYRTVFTNEFITDITSSTLSNTALHAHFHCGENLFVLETKVFKNSKRHMDKDWRSTHDYCHAGIWFKLCDERWNETNVSIPAFFCTVDCDIDRAVWLFLPYVLHLVKTNEVCLRAGTVNYLNLP